MAFIILKYVRPNSSNPLSSNKSVDISLDHVMEGEQSKSFGWVGNNANVKNHVDFLSARQIQAD